MHSRYANACYGLLLRAYPADFRRRFADDMRETFLHDLARVRRRGRLAVLSFWIATIGQAIWFGSAERRGGAETPLRVSSEPSSSRFRFNPGSDVRHAFRLMIRSPWFAVTAVLSLAIGLAASTVIFSLADALLLRASPAIAAPDRIVDIGRATNGSGHDNFSYPLFTHLRDNATTLEGAAAETLAPTPLSLVDGNSSERVFGQLVSASYFDVLGVRPAAGRLFVADDDAVPGDRAVAVLSYRFWQERFGGDPAVVGRTVRLNNTPFQVVGVAASAFEGSTFLGTDLWVPISMVGVVRGENAATLLGSARAVWHTAIGRLRPEATVESAHAELNALLQGFRSVTPELAESWSISVESHARVPPMVRTPFVVFVAVLFALTMGLLAVACSNVAGMLMARATARRREIATRLAIGASRGQILVQLVTETVVLFMLAVGVAVPLTFWWLGALRSFLPVLPFPIDLDLALDVRALLFAGGLALATGLVFGLLPARMVLKSDLAAALYGHSTTVARDRMRMRHGLVIAQVALSLTMVITAGLFVRTLLAASSVDPGFRTERIAIVSLDTTLTGFPASAAPAMIDRVVDRVRAIGGVDAVAYARMVPLQGSGLGLGNLRLPGADDAMNAQISDADWDVVSPNYFATIGLPIVDGRAFADTDRSGAPRVVILNETLARLAFPGESAVGKQIWHVEGRDGDGQPMTIVGVAKDARYRSIGETSRRFLYVPAAQHFQPTVNLYVKSIDDRTLINDIRQAVRSAEPGLPILVAQSFDDAVAIGLLPQRVAAWVAGGVGVLGVFLAALGLYGLMAFLVEQRRREIAIRMALGATMARVRGMVLGQALRLAAVGTVLGVAAATGIGMVIENLSLLIAVRPTDPVTFVGLSLVMAVVLFVASDQPARRAARTSPAATLQAE